MTMPKINFLTGLMFGMGLVVAMRLGWPMLQMLCSYGIHLLTTTP